MRDPDSCHAIHRSLLIAVFDILEEAGLEVYLVNARETKNLPGRKSDVQESQWLMKLHTYGLLRNSFRPPQEIRTLRTYWRQRSDLVRAAGRHIQRMQKALTQMNIQLANVLSDISGKSGQANGLDNGGCLREFAGPLRQCFVRPPCH
jgi:transposase